MVVGTSDPKWSSKTTHTHNPKNKNKLKLPWSASPRTMLHTRKHTPTIPKNRKKLKLKTKIVRTKLTANCRWGHRLDCKRRRRLRLRSQVNPHQQAHDRWMNGWIESYLCHSVVDGPWWMNGDGWTITCVQKDLVGNYRCTRSLASSRQLLEIAIFVGFRSKLGEYHIIIFSISTNCNYSVCQYLQVSVFIFIYFHLRYLVRISINK